MRYLLFLVLSCIIFTAASAQKDSVSMPPVFARIASEMQNFVPDTTAAPDDKITKKIIEIRQLRGGFNVNEAIEYKLQEDRQKGDITQEQFDKMFAFFASGNGRKWLDNAVIWIYRKHFTYSELKQMAKFYRTDAGKKMNNDFPVILLQSMKAAELIMGPKKQ